MVKIVSSENIRQLKTQKLIEDKKENIQLNKLANPPPEKIKRPLPFSRNLRRPPKAIQQPSLKKDDILKILESQQPRYNEYKQTLDRITFNLLAKGEFNQELNHTLQEKLKNSKDIKAILSKWLFDYINLDNETLILLATIGGYYLENKISNG